MKFVLEILYARNNGPLNLCYGWTKRCSIGAICQHCVILMKIDKTLLSASFTSLTPLISFCWAFQSHHRVPLIRIPPVIREQRVRTLEHHILTLRALNRFTKEINIVPSAYSVFSISMQTYVYVTTFIDQLTKMVYHVIKLNW